MLIAATYKNVEYLTKACSLGKPFCIFLRSLDLSLALITIGRLLRSRSLPGRRHLSAKVLRSGTQLCRGYRILVYRMLCFVKVDYGYTDLEREATRGEMAALHSSCPSAHWRCSLCRLFWSLIGCMLYCTIVVASARVAFLNKHGGPRKTALCLSSIIEPHSSMKRYTSVCWAIRERSKLTVADPKQCH